MDVVETQHVQQGDTIQKKKTSIERLQIQINKINLMFHGIKEEQDENEASLTNTAKNLISSILNVPDIPISNVIRLGQHVPNKTRLVKITFSDLPTRQKI